MSSPTKPTEHEQFVALFVRHENAVHSFILTLVPSLEDADEILQEASMTMWRRFDQYRPGTSFRNWAFQIAKYTTFNFIRKRARDRHRFSENVMTLLAEQAEREQNDLESQRRTLEHCIEKLGEGERTLLAGCYTEGATIKQFAVEQGRTPNAVSKQLNRVRRTLVLCVQKTLKMEAGA